jgi:hypothetical protein
VGVSSSECPGAKPSIDAHWLIAFALWRRRSDPGSSGSPGPLDTAYWVEAGVAQPRDARRAQAADLAKQAEESGRSNEPVYLDCKEAGAGWANRRHTNASAVSGSTSTAEQVQHADSIGSN